MPHRGNSHIQRSIDGASNRPVTAARGVAPVVRPAKAVRRRRLSRRFVQSMALGLAGLITIITVQIGAMNSAGAVSAQQAALVVWQSVALCGMAAFALTAIRRRP